MKSRHLLALAAAVATVGVSQLSVAGIVPQDPREGTASLSASSGGCFPPSAAVDLYLEAARAPGSVFNDAPDTQEACEDVCEKFEKTCDDIAHNSRTCGNNGGGKFASLLRTTCSTFLIKQDRNLCKDEVNEARNDVRDCNNADRHHAGACCDLWETEVCLKDCLDETFDVPRCFTGPSGFDGGSCWFQFFNNPL